MKEVFRDFPWMPDRTLPFDQTCLALPAAKYGWHRLDPTRYNTDGAIFGPDTIFCHYFGSSRRTAFYSQGIPVVRRLGVLANREFVPRLARC